MAHEKIQLLLLNLEKLHPAQGYLPLCPGTAHARLETYRCFKLH
jgi:hypothetical protein